MADKRYAHVPTGELVNLSFLRNTYGFKTLDFPVLPGVLTYCESMEWTPATLGADEVALNTFTVVDGEAIQDKRAKTDVEKSAAEQNWVRSELERSDVMVNRHQDNHGRPPAGTLAAWRTYRNALRDHVINDVVQGARPTAPDA